MSDFLAAMAASSRERVHAARRTRSFAELQAEAALAPPVRPLVLDRFDVIAEVKLASPSVGVLDANGGRAEDRVVARAKAYERGGACAVSVLTEPSRFGGSLDHLAAAARAIAIPTMRKDFLVDAWQVWEARAAGASGVLVVLRIVDEPTLDAMLVAAAATGMFVLLEAFDEAELKRASAVVTRGGARLLVGVNTRDLGTLTIAPGRLAALAGHLPGGVPAVAESGLTGPADVAHAAHLGYHLALVGTSLMSDEHPADAVLAMRRAGREAVCTSA